MTFPAAPIIDGFIRSEKALAEALHYVPYCPEHEAVWSPIFADCIISSCHQLDSLWKATFRAAPPTTPAKSRLDITDYFQQFGKPGDDSIDERWVVFWSEHTDKIHPFREWDRAPEYKSLPWWTTYTDLKHDRWSNINKATLKNAVQATSALFLAIARCSYCHEAIVSADWVSDIPRWNNLAYAINPDAEAWLNEKSEGVRGCYLAVESILFSYPVGWCKGPINPGTFWRGRASPRFKRWFDSQYGSSVNEQH